MYGIGHCKCFQSKSRMESGGGEGGRKKETVQRSALIIKSRAYVIQLYGLQHPVQTLNTHTLVVVHRAALHVAASYEFSSIFKLIMELTHLVPSPPPSCGQKGRDAEQCRHLRQGAEREFIDSNRVFNIFFNLPPAVWRSQRFALHAP